MSGARVSCSALLGGVPADEQPCAASERQRGHREEHVELDEVVRTLAVRLDEQARKGRGADPARVHPEAPPGEREQFANGNPCAAS